MKNKKGFTLIEVLAVIVLLGILVSVATVGVSKYRKDVDEKEKYSIRQTIISSFNNYRLMHNVESENSKGLDSENNETEIINLLKFDGGNVLKYSGDACNISDSKVLYIINGEHFDAIDDKDKAKYRVCELNKNGECAGETPADYVRSKMETVCIKLSCDEGKTFIIDDFSDNNSLCSKVIFE